MFQPDSPGELSDPSLFFGTVDRSCVLTPFQKNSTRKGGLFLRTLCLEPKKTLLPGVFLFHYSSDPFAVLRLASFHIHPPLRILTKYPHPTLIRLDTKRIPARGNASQESAHKAPGSRWRR
jgi:hypothetical protein